MLTRRFWFRFAGAALIGALLISWRCVSHEYEISEYPYQQNPAFNTFDFLLVVGRLPWLAARCIWHWLHANHDAVLSLSIAILAVVTTLLAIYTAKLWGETKRLADDAIESSARQSEEAKISKRAYIAVRRAWLNLDDRAAPKATVEIANLGETPAYHVRAWIHIWITAHPLRESLPAPDGNFEKSDRVLSKGDYFPMRIEKAPPVPQESVDTVGTANGTIYVYGSVEYRDVFGDERWVNYRLFHGESEGMDDESTLKVDQKGNDTSESHSLPGRKHETHRA